jgi:hypothetical protein
MKSIDRRRTIVSKVPISPIRLKTAKSASLFQGIKTLEDFGFSSEAYNPTLPALNAFVLPSEQRAPTAVHVSDFWSHRQQRLFLQQTGLKAAQNARERQQRHEVYIAQRNKIEGMPVADEIYSRLLAENDPMEAARLYAAGKNGRFLKQIANQLHVNSPRRVLRPTPKQLKQATGNVSNAQRLEELLSRCDATLSRTQTSRQ